MEPLLPHPNRARATFASFAALHRFDAFRSDSPNWRRAPRREFLAGAGSLCCPNALMFLGHYAELISIRGFVLLLGSNTPGEKVEP